MVVNRMSSNDKDFDYKIRFQRILWKMGFWTRSEIPVLAYSTNTYVDNLKKHDLTDLDVYGELLNTDFSINKYIADCKSGRQVKSTERVFWLKGVMEFTKADKGFLIKKNVTDHIRLILDSMNIYAIDNNNLLELEKLYNTSSINELFSKEYYIEREKIIGSLSEEYKKIYQYLSQRYWYNSNHINLNVILTMLNKNEFHKSFEKNNKSHLFLLLENIIFLTRVIFECCNYVLHRNIADIPQAVLEYIHGGVTGYNQKKNILREIKSMVNTYLPNEAINVEENDIKPVYYQPLLELILSIITEPLLAKDIIRYLEIFQHEVILEKKYDFNQYFANSYSNITLKLAKDIIRFYSSFTKVNSDIFESILEI